MMTGRHRETDIELSSHLAHGLGAKRGHDEMDGRKHGREWALEKGAQSRWDVTAADRLDAFRPDCSIACCQGR